MGKGTKQLQPLSTLAGRKGKTNKTSFTAMSVDPTTLLQSYSHDVCNKVVSDTNTASLLNGVKHALPLASACQQSGIPNQVSKNDTVNSSHLGAQDPPVMTNTTSMGSIHCGLPGTISTATYPASLMLTTTIPSMNLDMSMTLSEDHMTKIVKECVKAKLFRAIKFFDREKHGFYSEAPNTACGKIIKHTNVVINGGIKQAREWWKEIRKTVISTIGNHRNNCIKNIRNKFNGKFKVCVNICRVAIAHTYSKRSMAITYLLTT
jgi:hypothetical protein